MTFKVSANATGKTKQVAGFDAKEMVLKMEMEGTDKKSGQKGAMTITTDMWIAPGVPATRRSATSTSAWPTSSTGRRAATCSCKTRRSPQGMAEVSKEIAKLDGMPVEQFITMGAAGQPGAAPAGSQAPPPQEQQAQQEKPSIGGALGGALGGRFGLGRKKTSSNDQAAQKNGSAPASGGAPGSLLEMTTVMSNFNSNPVDDSAFAVPAGFKKVESDLKKMR